MCDHLSLLLADPPRVSPFAVLRRRLPRCMHMFHEDCLIPWLRDCQGTCPVCRLPLSEQSSREESSDASRSATFSAGVSVAPRSPAPYDERDQRFAQQFSEPQLWHHQHQHHLQLATPSHHHHERRHHHHHHTSATANGFRRRPPQTTRIPSVNASESRDSTARPVLTMVSLGVGPLYTEVGGSTHLESSAQAPRSP